MSTDYAVYDPTDVRKVGGKLHAYKRVGVALVRPATKAERAYFEPLHAALRAQSRKCLAAHWQAKREAAGLGRDGAKGERG